LSENFFQQHEIDLFAYYEINRTKINNSFAIDHTTIGINHTGSYSNLSTIFEAAYQPGSLVGSNVSAYLLSLQGNYNFNSANLGLGADIISGRSEERRVGKECSCGCVAVHCKEKEIW